MQIMDTMTLSGTNKSVIFLVSDVNTLSNLLTWNTRRLSIHSSPVNILQRRTLAYLKAVEDTPPSSVHSSNQEEATSTRNFLNAEVGLQERATSQGYSVVQQDRLDAFGDFNRHIRVYVRCQKKAVQTANMKSNAKIDSLPNDTLKIVRNLGQSNISHSLDVVMR